MITRPVGMGAFQFVTLARLRVGQLMKGCRPRVDGTDRPIVTAQVEVAEGKVTPALDEPAAGITAAPRGDESMMSTERQGQDVRET